MRLFVFESVGDDNFVTVDQQLTAIGHTPTIPARGLESGAQQVDNDGEAYRTSSRNC